MSTPGTRPTTIVPLSANVLLSHGPVSPRSIGPEGALAPGRGRFASAAPAFELFVTGTTLVGRAPFMGGLLPAVVGRSGSRPIGLPPDGRARAESEARAAP